MTTYTSKLKLHHKNFQLIKVVTYSFVLNCFDSNDVSRNYEQSTAYREINVFVFRSLSKMRRLLCYYC